MASTPIFKPLSMADAYLSSTLLPTTLKTSPYPFLSLPSKPIKFLHLSSFASPSWVSLKKKPSSSPLVPLVASTSDWAQQEEENQVQQEEEEFKWENQEGEEDGTEARLSDWEGEGEEGEEERTEGSGGEDGLFEEGGEEGGQEEEEAELSEDAKLFVGNLPYDVDSEILAQLFDQAGVVEVAEVIYSRQTDQSRGFGFVTMSSVEEAEKAVEMLHRFDMDGRSLTVNKAAPRGASPERTPRAFGASFRIYVGNLPWQVDETRLEQVFSEHGKVLEAKVIYDKETGRSRGFGFVAMSSQTELDDAIAALDGQSLDGRALKVNVAEERPRRGSF